jgi:hypothetical protein
MYKNENFNKNKFNEILYFKKKNEEVNKLFFKKSK